MVMTIKFEGNMFGLGGSSCVGLCAVSNLLNAVLYHETHRQGSVKEHIFQTSGGESQDLLEDWHLSDIDTQTTSGQKK